MVQRARERGYRERPAEAAEVSGGTSDAPFPRRVPVSLKCSPYGAQEDLLGPTFGHTFCISVSFGNGSAASLRLSLLRMEAALLCPVAAGTRCEWRACLRHLGGGFFSHSSPSDHLRRYFFQVSFAPHFIRGPRCWASGRMQHIQGATFLTRTHRARSARSPHTYRRPFPSGIPPRSTRVCGQTEQGLRGWQRGRLRPV